MKALFANAGTLDKFIGDAVMALFGVPLELPDHALRACHAALAMQKSFRAHVAGSPEPTIRGLHARVGLHTGTAAFGNLGSSSIMSLTAMGDAVNLASRLEAVNKIYGTSVLASEATVSAAGPGLSTREIDFVRVAGRRERVRSLRDPRGGSALGLDPGAVRRRAGRLPRPFVRGRRAVLSRGCGGRRSAVAGHGRARARPSGQAAFERVGRDAGARPEVELRLGSPAMNRLLSLGVLLPALGCAAWLPAPVPMTSISDVAPSGKGRCLVVFLPGRGDSAEDFVREGFVGALRERKLSVDIVAANATLGYYLKNTLVDWLSADVLDAWLAKGYEQVWAIGNSMGGLGTLIYPLRKPGVLTGILALAPYLGDEPLIHEIEKQGGLAKWAAPPKATTFDQDNYQGQLWRWLQAVTRGERRDPLSTWGSAPTTSSRRAWRCSRPSCPRGTPGRRPGAMPGRCGARSSSRFSTIRTSRAPAPPGRRAAGRGSFA